MGSEHGLTRIVRQAGVSFGGRLCAVAGLLQLQDRIATGYPFARAFLGLGKFRPELMHDRDEHRRGAIVGIHLTRRVGDLLDDCVESNWHRSSLGKRTGVSPDGACAPSTVSQTQAHRALDVKRSETKRTF